MDDDAPAVPICQASDLALNVRWTRDGAGLRGQVVAENISGRACRLPGKPGIVPIGQDGTPLPVDTIVTLEMLHPGYVDLAPGERAAAPAGWGNWCGQPVSRRALVRWDGAEAVADVEGPPQPDCERGRPDNLTSSWFRLIQ